MCICEGDNTLFYPLNQQTVEYSNIEIALGADMLRARYFNEEGYMITQDIIMIKYCPFCGKPLRNKEKIKK